MKPKWIPSFMVGWCAGVACFFVALHFQSPVKEGDYRGQHYEIFKDLKGFYPSINGVSVAGRYPYRDSHYVTIEGAIDEAKGTISMDSGNY
jgi:hypothetical protein